MYSASENSTAAPQKQQVPAVKGPRGGVLLAIAARLVRRVIERLPFAVAGVDEQRYAKASPGGCCATVPADTVTVSLATKRRTGLACVTVGAGDRSVVDTIGSIPRWFDNGDRVR